MSIFFITSGSRLWKFTLNKDWCKLDQDSGRDVVSLYNRKAYWRVDKNLTVSGSERPVALYLAAATDEEIPHWGECPVGNVPRRELR